MGNEYVYYMKGAKDKARLLGALSALLFFFFFKPGLQT